MMPTTAQTKRPILSSSFRTAYDRLNPAQKQAADTIEGPVMVIAGPGTGKTETVAVRVANILKKTQMRPSNILCLTFTKSGSTAMRERLRKLIGPDAYGVTIDTIHGFCNGIISSHPEVFEEWSALEQISDIERYRAINKIIDGLMPDMILVSRKSPYSRTKQIIHRISQLKREGVIDREKLLAIADEYKKEMQGKSRDGTKQHEKNLRTARKFREFLEVFFGYQEMLEETGRYDYEDMILRVTQALREEDWLLASLQERYQYVLLDEVQDTNGSQWQFVDLLTTDPTKEDKPNLFVVGDDDQAIFRFQGANLQNILSFHKRFKNAPIITLTESYRCSQEILDSAGNLISENEERLVGKVEGIQKDLRASKGKSGLSPTLLRPPSDMSEPWLIADLLEERIKNGIPPEEIAVIVQTNSELQPIYDVLSSRGIPTEMSGKVDLLSHHLINQAILLLHTICAPGENHLFASALACECFALEAVDIARLCKISRDEKTKLMDLIVALRHGELDAKFLEQEKLVQAGELILKLHQSTKSRTIVELLEKVLRESGLLEKHEEEIDVIDIAVAQEFFDRIKLRAYEQPGFTLSALLSDLDFYLDPNYKDLRLTYDLPHLTSNGVQLMTAHKSKGLEFNTVILANFREGHWDRRRNPSSLSVPEDLLFGWEKKQKSFEQGQDERRVAYVAMTRAKEELIFVCPKELTTGESIKAISPSGFFAEAGSLLEKHSEIREPESASTLLHPVIRERSIETTAFLKEQIENFTLSASSLNDFLEDPLLFFNKHLLRLPEARNPSYAYGNAVHHVLAEWGLSMQKKQPLEKDVIIEKFRDHLKQKEVLTIPERKRLEHLGVEALTKFYATSLKDSSAYIHKVECPLRTHLGDIPIKGKIDRIDLAGPNDARALIYDYKTGKPKAPAEIEKYGYARQLLFYDLLVRGAMPLLKPQEYVLSFVGEDSESPKLRSYTFSDSERKELTEVIKKVWEKIVNLDFTTIV
jgi:DNA helicase II / ATP-dependent DNA helicase PcrA